MMQLFITTNIFPGDVLSPRNGVAVERART